MGGRQAQCGGSLHRGVHPCPRLSKAEPSRSQGWRGNPSGPAGVEVLRGGRAPRALETEVTATPL